MKKQIFLLTVLFILSASLVQAESCDELCADEGYTSGTCREVTEDSICDEGETAFGFDTCTDFDRCCCTGAILDNSTEENNTTEDLSIAPGSCVSLPETIFWFLLILVALLILANISRKKKKSGLEELEDLI